MTVEQAETAPKDDREQASAALVAAIVQMMRAFGCDQAARVFGSVASDLKAKLDGQADANASTKH